MKNKLRSFLFPVYYLLSFIKPITIKKNIVVDNPEVEKKTIKHDISTAAYRFNTEAKFLVVGFSFNAINKTTRVQIIDQTTQEEFTINESFFKQYFQKLTNEMKLSEAEHIG